MTEFSFKRSARVQEVIMREVSAIIRDEVKDPRIGFITITAVDLTDKLNYARVFISPMGTEEEKQDTFKGICSASKFIRSQLGKRMRIRYVPELHFQLDHAPDEADHINKLFQKMHQDQEL